MSELDYGPTQGAHFKFFPNIARTRAMAPLRRSAQHLLLSLKIACGYIPASVARRRTTAAVMMV